MEGCVFQRKGEERRGIQYLEEVFHEALRGLQAMKMHLITEGVDMGDNMSLMISLRRGWTTEVLNRLLELAVIEDNN